MTSETHEARKRVKTSPKKGGACKKMKKTIKLRLLASACIALLMLLASACIMPIAFADSYDTSPGTAHVLPAEPVITNPELWNSGETVDKNNTALVVNTEYHVNFTVSHASKLSYLDNLTINMWNSGGGVGENDTSTQRNRYQFLWEESTGTWSCPLSASYIVTGNCKDPGQASSLTSYEFTLAFKLSKVANYSNGGAPYDGWQIKIYAYDEAPKYDSIQTLQFGVASYFDVTITDTTHAWSNLIPGTSVNVTVDGDADIDFTVIANTNWKAQVEADGPLSKAPDTIPLTNLLVHKDTLGSAVAMTVEYADVGGLTNQSPPTNEDPPTETSLKLWLTVPEGTPPGDYTYTLSIQIVIQS